MPYLVCVINFFRDDDPATFKSEEEYQHARATMHFLCDSLDDAEREQDHWAHHTCCDWSPAFPLEVADKPAVCPLCGEPLTWTDDDPTADKEEPDP